MNKLDPPELDSLIQKQVARPVTLGTQEWNRGQVQPTLGKYQRPVKGSHR